MRTTAEEAALARDVAIRETQIRAADCGTCGAGPGEPCTDMCGWPALEQVTRPIGLSHEARMQRAMPGLAELSRAEAAYAHLASFARGQEVIVSAKGFSHEGAVTRAQQDGGSLEEAYLAVSGLADICSPGGPSTLDGRVTVARMLSGECLTVVAKADAADEENWPHFDEAARAR